MVKRSISTTLTIRSAKGIELPSVPSDLSAIALYAPHGAAIRCLGSWLCDDSHGGGRVHTSTIRRDMGPCHFLWLVGQTRGFRGRHGCARERFAD